jgi:hypothetical protein
VRQRADARQADGKVAVVRVGKSDAGRLDEEPQTLGVHRRDGGRGLGLLVEDRSGLVARQDGLVRGAVGQADAALESPGERPHGFENDRPGEVTGQEKASADGEGLLGHGGGRFLVGR